MNVTAPAFIDFGPQQYEQLGSHVWNSDLRLDFGHSDVVLLDHSLA